MFYDHEILTNRKYGVATIWLVATLGSRSSLKKVTRKAILDVDLPKACDTISTPDAPMALRLQGSLLYGVSRVFSQKCGYVLTDAQSLQNKMKVATTTSIGKDLQIDPTITSTRRDQLNLTHNLDLNFDLDAAFDLSIFNTPNSDLERFSMLSPRSLRSSQSSLLAHELGDVNLVLPPLRTPDSDLFGGGTSSVIRSAGIDLARGDQDEPAIYDESIFHMDDDGDVLLFGSEDQLIAPGYDLNIPLNQGVGVIVDTTSEVGHNQQVSGNDQEISPYEVDHEVFQLGGDDDLHLPLVQTPPTYIGAVVAASELSLPEPVNTDHDSEATGGAPQRKARILKPLQADLTAELSNRQLAEWNDNYLDNMAESRDDKLNRQALIQAKKNAAFWILSQGIGGVEVNFGEDLTPHPFAVFSGQTLLDALTGTRRTDASKKRSRSVSDHGSSGDDGRHVRNKSKQLQAAEGGYPALDENEDMPMVQDDDFHIESEVGRQAPSSLKDRSSQMPWNISSRHGSVRTYGSGLGRVSSSVGGVARLDLGPPSLLPGRRSRLTSASPLVGKGRVESLAGSIETQDPTFLTNLDMDDFNDTDAQLGAAFEDDNFQLYGPVAAVDTQTAVQDQWIASTLENEALNFLGFLDAEIREKSGHGDALGDIEPTAQTITFGALLPPETNSKPVGAQAMIHVLLLASRGLITVHQSDAFGDIIMGIIDGPHSVREMSEDV